MAGKLPGSTECQQDSVVLGLTASGQDRRRARPPATSARVERPAGPARLDRARASRDFVTEVDRTAERIIADVLLAAEPGSRIVGEELSPEVVTRRAGLDRRPARRHHQLPARLPGLCRVDRGGGGRRARGRRSCCTCRADERLHGASGAAAPGRANAGSRSRPSPIPAFALIGTGFPFKDTRALDEYLAPVRPRRGARPAASAGPAPPRSTWPTSRRDGSTASGSSGSSAWDIAAGMLLVREAGGVVTDFAGRDIGVEHTGGGRGQSGDARLAAGDGERVIRTEARRRRGSSATNGPERLAGASRTDTISL